MFQFVNAVSQSAIGAVALMALEFISIAIIAILSLKAWEWYQAGHKRRANLRLQLIKNRREEVPAWRNN